MQWHSAAEFFAMGGYGLYVWGSMGACALCMLGEPLLLSHRRRQALNVIKRERMARQLDQAPQGAFSVKTPTTRPLK